MKISPKWLLLLRCVRWYQLLTPHVRLPYDSLSQADSLFLVAATSSSLQECATFAEECLEVAKIQPDEGIVESHSINERIWIHMLAGIAAGTVSRTLTAPFDRLKTMAQLYSKDIPPLEGMRMMIKEGGFWSMWRGNGTNLIKVVPEITFKYICYNEIKHLLDTDNSIFDSIVAGCLTGVLGQTVTHPLEVFKTRLTLRKTGEPSGIYTEVVSGLKMYGSSFLFLGYLPATLGKCLFTGLDFTIYQVLKNKFHISHNPEKRTVFFCGLLSSCIAHCISYPFGVLTVYKQARDKLQDNENFNMYDLVKHRGIRNMYRGLPIALWKGMPAAAIAYVVYEFVLELFGEEMKE